MKIILRIIGLLAACFAFYFQALQFIFGFLNQRADDPQDYTVEKIAHIITMAMTVLFGLYCLHGLVVPKEKRVEL